MKAGGKFHRIWLGSRCAALTVEVTFFHPNDRDESKREIILEIPWRIWRPYCWAVGNHRGEKRDRSDYYGECVYCGFALPSKKAK